MVTKGTVCVKIKSAWNKGKLCNLGNIQGVTILCLLFSFWVTTFWGTQKMLGVNIFWGSTFFMGQTKCWVNNFWGNFLGVKDFGGSNNFWGHNFLGVNIFWGQHFLNTHVASTALTCAPKKFR
jgi:hypothetical protein